jgi:Uma2 family endonuclease
MEQIYVHSQVKYQVGLTLGPLVEGRGIYVPEGVLLTNPKAGLSTTPDGLFVSDEAFEKERIREVEGAEEGFVELEGTPELVVEVVSRSSETKDLVDLPHQYWKAGIAEYWVIDARGDEVLFEILKHGRRGYTSTKKQPEGWLKSNVFGRSFRIIRGRSKRSRPTFKLEVK